MRDGQLARVRRQEWVVQVVGQPLKRLAWLCAYSYSCSVLHGLLQQQYFARCGASWLSFLALEPQGPGCALIRRGLSLLRWSPLLASGLWLPLRPREDGAGAHAF